jgi:hypothetical protein
MEEKVYVKTTYESQTMQEPDISEYDSKEEANGFITTCLKWGIGIVSCNIISKDQAVV